MSGPQPQWISGRFSRGEKTIRRWLRQPEFSRAYQEARRQVFADALADLRVATHDAVEALRKVVREETGALRVKAARTVLELSIRSAETLEFEIRLKRLESLFSPSNEVAES